MSGSLKFSNLGWSVSNLSQGIVSVAGDTKQSTKQVVFVEDSLSNWQTLASLVPAEVELVVLDHTRDGLAQIGAYLAGKAAGSVDSVVLMSHGGSGYLDLGSQIVNIDNLGLYSESFKQISGALSADADWLIYGCDVAEGQQGGGFIQALADLSGADVAASTGVTGRGGNWVLEARTGEVATFPDWVASAETAYSGDLGITHNFESGNTFSGNGTSVLTLRNNTSNVSLKLTAMQGVWKAGSDVFNGYSTTFSGSWGLNEAGSSTYIVLTVDLDNNGTFGDAFSFNGFKLADPSFNGGFYKFKPNGSSTGQETFLLNSMIDAYTTYSPVFPVNFNNITSLSVQFSDSATGIAVDDFDISAPVTPNTAPTFTSGSSGSVSENASPSTVVYTATATDAESDPITYSLSGTDAALLTINSSTGVMRLVSSANYEAKNSYSVNVVASDGVASASQAVTISIIDVNESPVFSSAASGSVAENASTSTVVYTAAAADPEGGSLIYGLAGTDAALFTINSSTGAITLNASADYEAKSSYSLNLHADDGVNVAVKAITIAVTNVNEKPAIAAPASQNVSQNTATALTGISVADPDSGSNMITLSLSAPAGTFAATSGSGVTALGSGTSSLTLSGTQTNINSFISANKVTYTTAAAATGTVTLSIGSNDGGNSGSGGTQTDSKTETLNILLPNAAPVITSSASASVQENEALSTVVYTATATDAENDAITYSLTGADALLFSINSTSGEVTLASPADYETKSSYSITVNAADALHTTTQAVTVNVTDVNEAPVNLTLSASSVDENTATPVAVGTLSGVDDDGGESFTYSIVGGADQASFQTVGNSLQFKAGTTLDFETKNSYSVTVRATDHGGLSFDKAFNVGVADANDRALITAPASRSVWANISSTLLDISVSDQDAGTNPITLQLNVSAGTLKATSGNGVGVSGTDSATLTLVGAQSAINTFISSGNVVYFPQPGAANGGTVNMTISSDDGGFSGGPAQSDTHGVVFNLVNYVAPPGPGPVVPVPVVTTTTIDGVSISLTSTTDAQGKTISLLSVPVVTSTRIEDANTPNGKLADIPLVADGQGQAQISVGLPVGVGLVSQSLDGNAQTLHERLVSLASTLSGGADLSNIVSQGIDAFVGQTTDQQQVVVRQVSFLSNGLAPGQALTVSGTTGLGESDASHPLRQEALVIDARSLPAGTVINLENVEFGVIVGAVRVEGGSGKNFVVGDGQSQFILLGPEDDVLRGGGGDDTIASKGGNDQLYGDDGNDRVIGGQGNDQLYGGSGNDLLQGGQSDAGSWRFVLNKQGGVVGQFTPQEKGLADLPGLVEISQWLTEAGGKVADDPRFALIYRDPGDLRDVALLCKTILGSLPETKVLSLWAQTPLSAIDVAKMGYEIYQSQSDPSALSLESQVSNLIKYVWGADNPQLSRVGADYLSHGGNWAEALLYLVRNNPGNSALFDASGNLPLSLDWKTGEVGCSIDTGNDLLNGGAGNDVLLGGRGNNVIDGGDGTDLAVFFGNLNGWGIVQGSQTNQIVITNVATGETNQVSNVELFEVGGQIYRLKGEAPTTAGNLADYVQAASSADIALIGVENWLATQ